MMEYAYAIIISIIASMILFNSAFYASTAIKSISSLNIEINHERNLKIIDYELKTSILNITYE